MPSQVNGTGLRRGRRAMTALAVVLIVGAAVYVGACAWRGVRRTVYFVNGLSTHYAVVVNGKPITLPVGLQTKVRTGEGAIRISVPDKTRHIADGTCEVRTPFWTRPFLTRAFVINPDRGALLARVAVTYVPEHSVAPADDNRVFWHTGRLLYEFRDIDYLFKPLPERVTLEGDNRVLQSVQLVPDPSLLLALERLKGQTASPDLQAFLRARMLDAPEDIVTLGVVAAHVDTDTLLRWFELRLEDRPVLVNWRRTWQSTLLNEGRRDEVVARCRRWLAADPENGALLYLMGRAVEDIDASAAYFRRAVAADPPCAYAWHAMAYQALGEARFAEALDLARKARAAMPAEPLFELCELPAMMGLGRLEDLLARARLAAEKAPYQMAHAEAELTLRMMMGETVAAREAVDNYLDRLKKVVDGRIVDDVKTSLDAAHYYLSGDVAAFAKAVAAKGGSDAALAFRAHVSTGKLDEAAALLDKLPADPYAPLLLYIAAAHAGKSELADRAFARAVAAMRKGGYDIAWFADHLAADAPDVDAVLRRPMMPSQKRVLLAAFGLRHSKDPEGRARCFALARKLNIDRPWPYLLLKDVLGPAAK